MKIATLTFHWGTNYGATLQAYALQNYIKSLDYDTEIIDYRPLRVRQYELLWTIVRRDINTIIKHGKFRKFRKEHLTLSKRIYRKNKDLTKHCHMYDTYITGSDQVWNIAFTQRAEGTYTLSYYLNFVKDNKKRISYAVSFGTNKLPQDVIDKVKPELCKYHAISVREQTGKKIIEDIKLDATITLDPTLLLTKDDYEKLIPENVKKQYHLFSYILHDNQTTAHNIKDYIFNKYFDTDKQNKYENQPISIEEWLYNVKNSQFVITNSFHGTIFSIIFHKSFIVVPVEGSDMNDRITTLLNNVGLQDRIASTVDKQQIDNLIKEKIDWSKIDLDLKAYKRKSEDFLLNSLK